ncbi:helix-turn-helix transcriptional regulator [Pelagibaculum spongiae]|uniref:WYL domain-containing protein n=1 Tax=Pelagibaculum spongiae TaxID=2080658 RepID=A0A2V1GVH1_9GAMM|nr:WYL domain-containing protein [Pelagibaculum spongiae]PVZ70395.1 WYL domain-containing protein [Pelagibaculum spongiae]
MAANEDNLEFTLSLLAQIPSRPSRTSVSELLDALSAEYTCSERKIQRKLKFLTEQGYIEQDNRSKPYGYWLIKKPDFLSAAGLTAQQSLLLKLAEDHLTNLLPVSVMRSMKPIFQQAELQVNQINSADKPESQWLNKVRLVSETQPLLAPAIADGIFETISEALYHDKYLDLRYKNAKGQQKDKQGIMPLGMAQQGKRIYLVCRFPGYDNERSLALHRIESAKKSTLGFKRPTDFDLKKYDNDGRFGFGEGKKCRLSFHIKKSAGHHLSETKLSEDQTIEPSKEHKDYLHITATVIDSKQLHMWLNSFGEDVWGITTKQKS